MRAHGSTTTPIIRPATREDLRDILEVEWRSFPGQYEFRYSPIELINTFNRYPWAFRVAATPERVIGYSCAAYLTEDGSNRVLAGECDALQDMKDGDVVGQEGVVSHHLHLEVLAVLDPDDIVTASKLIRDLLTAQLERSIHRIRVVTAAGITPIGNRLLQKAGFQVAHVGKRLSDGTKPILYFLDLKTAAGGTAAVRFGLMKLSSLIAKVMPLAKSQTTDPLLDAKRQIEYLDVEGALDDLDRYCRENPTDPRVWAYLGVAAELLGDKRLAIERYLRAIELYEPLRSELPVAWLNTAILYDKLRRPDRVAEVLDHQPRKVAGLDHEFWFKAGLQYMRINRFDQALTCFGLVQEHHSPDVATLIRMGYCYEGLGDPRQAISRVQSARNIVGAQDDFVDLEGYPVAIPHALGHFYSSLFTQTGGPNDRDEAIRYMRTAAQSDSTLRLCLADVLLETGDSLMALQELKDVAQDEQIMAHPEVYNQLFFSRGQVYLNLERHEDALQDFAMFREFCSRAGDRDGVALAEFLSVKTRLMQRRVGDMTTDELIQYRAGLVAHHPSEYVVPGFRRAYECLLSLLGGLLNIKEYLRSGDPQHKRSAVTKLEQALELTGSERDKSPQLPLLVLSDQRFEQMVQAGISMPVHIEPVNCPRNTEERREADQLCSGYDVWLGCYETVIPEVHLELIANYRGLKTIVVCDRRGTGDAFRVRDVLWTQDPEEAISVCYVTLLYESACRLLVEPISQAGLAPLSERPLAASQRGSLMQSLELFMPVYHPLDVYSPIRGTRPHTTRGSA